MTADPSRQLRCAIYTRKSSEEGLDQTFNSLHAQRELCEAYVRSQAGEGWEVVAQRYDDGGFSGGALDRPALRHLLADIAAGRLDVVVVYKVDRLTRSLADFARLIEAFDQAGVAFVSVTQAFNTTGSMGRLTLNILLSFAQFEREVTSERIRDKVAASKAKGMWMGGICPLGYDPPSDDRSRLLVVNPEEAATVRLIFRRLLELESLTALQQWLDEEGIRSKRRTAASGRQSGGVRMTRGAVRQLLKNPVYIGQIRHKDRLHPSRHKPIVEPEIFEAAQLLLARLGRARRDHVPQRVRLLLAGKVFGGHGQPMPALVAYNKARPYHYYGGPRLPDPLISEPQDDAIRKVAAAELDRVVVERLMALEPTIAADDVAGIRGAVARVEVHPTSVQIIFRRAALEAIKPEQRGIEGLRGRLPVGDQLMADAQWADCLRVVAPIRMKMRGGRVWSHLPAGHDSVVATVADPDAIRRLRRAHLLLRNCGLDPTGPPERLQRGRAPDQTHDVALAHWAFLAPDIQEGILKGEIGREAISRLDVGVGMPLDWEEQRRRLKQEANQRC